MALLDGTRLLEVFIERSHSRGVAGNIYKGRVTRVLPGMQAAFVDIGLEKAAFLHVSDLYPESAALSSDEEAESPAAALEAASGNGDLARRPIEELLKKGNELLVQVAKEPIGGKGARITAQISLPGRYLVFLPGNTHLGVSRSIAEERERERIREIIASLRPPEGGMIARTSCEGQTKRDIVADLRFLTRLWSRISKKAESVGAPALLHYDMDLILRVIRDLVTPEVHRVLVDNPRDYQRILSFIETVMPRMVARVSLYEGAEPIFDRFNLETQIARALDRQVRLKSGGYLIIDYTEALTVIDVNTGRFVGKHSQEETALRTNLEAVKTVVEQLRLRNIGGLIIIDFIDMEQPASRRKVYDALTEALKKDKARTNILRLSELGLVEMTRKRTRESLPQLLCSPCPHCDGTGRVRAVQTVAYDILRHIRREVSRNPDLARITVKTHPEVARFLTGAERRGVEQIERETGKHITITASPELPEATPFEVLGSLAGA